MVREKGVLAVDLWLIKRQWTPDEVRAWAAQMRASLTNPTHHAFHTMYVLHFLRAFSPFHLELISNKLDRVVVYGRKP